MRRSVRAIVIKEGKILVLKRTFPDAIFWTFPGGGIEENETEKQALERECLEETSVAVKAGKHYYRQIFKGNINDFYLCEYLSGEALEGSGPEYSNDRNIYNGEHEPEWLEIKDLGNHDLRPNELRDKIIREYNK